MPLRIFMQRPVWPVLLGGFIVICLLSTLALTRQTSNVEQPGFQIGGRSEQPEPLPPKPEANIVKALTADEALAANASMPFSHELLEAARPFSTDQASSPLLASNSALDCLTAAVYYEAAGQGEAGERAVAQVVLNRVRHPAFPASVCGVVYQGSDRATGCQFTFTCDGSLARKPDKAGWNVARQIAAQSLAGKVDRAVGMATHYHANYVVPYWASNLTKIAAVGDHIFYRWPGYWGRRSAFRQAYAGEVSSDTVLAAATAIEPQSVALGAQVTLPSNPTPLADIGRIQLIAQGVPQIPQRERLRADEDRGTLRVDDEQPQNTASLAGATEVSNDASQLAAVNHQGGGLSSNGQSIFDGP
jgi:spore germination cell wall hydrolase CwlJ-like protein